MNKKILLALLIIPIMAFTTNQAVKSFSKTKKIKNHLFSSNHAITDAYENNTLLNSSEDDIINEIKKSINNKEERNEAYKKSTITNLWDDKVSESTRGFIDKKVIAKVKKENICSLNLNNSMFSRCPSGYNARLISENNIITNTGWLCVNNGCRHEPIAIFKFDEKENTVEVKVNDTIGFISLNKYCELYKEAIKTPGKKVLNRFTK